MDASAGTNAWWKTSIIYQIYPCSLRDTGGDGIGDLPGIREKLGYLASLGVGALWLSPIYPSPMRDFGYDVADYTAIHPWFGTLEDFDGLLAEVHAQGMKLILDFVPNHTSDEHPWFIASRSDLDHPMRDWYIWRDPGPGGGPPNNWLSFFGGPAWTLDRSTGQYYLHQFTVQQPELNYRNPVLIEEILDCWRFWLDRGVDGFRVDVIWLLMKDSRFRDEPSDPNWDGSNPHGRLQHIHTGNLPEVHEVIRRMRAVLDEYQDRMMVGEISLPNEELMRYYGTGLDECHLPVNFQLIHTPWEAGRVRALVDRYEAALPEGAWPNWVLGNHDQRRIASRIGAPQARVAAMLLLTLRGTPTWYYGDEIGMVDVPIPLTAMKDPQGLNQPERAEQLSRDPARTPMQWDASRNAGFTLPEAQPWLPLAADSGVRNVAAQSRDPGSMLSLFRALTAIRRRSPALTIGSYGSVAVDQHEVFAYIRSAPGQRYLAVLNFGAGSHALALPALGDRAEVLLSTAMDRGGEVEMNGIQLRPDEGLLLCLMS